MKMLITGGNGFIGSYLASVFKKARVVGHNDFDLSDWESIKKIKYEPEVIINCAHYGKFREDKPGSVEKNISILVNLRRKWPKARLISFGSGAMYGRERNVIKAKEYDKAYYPADNYGLAKRLTVDLSDATLIIFGLFARQRFVETVLNNIKIGKPVEIFQEAMFSWVNLSDLPEAINWAIKKCKGRYNLCGYDMTLTQMAKYLGAKKFKYLKPGMANEYTGSPSRIKLTKWPNF